MMRTQSKGLVLSVLGFLVAAAACGGQAGQPTETPPSQPTHHAVVEGVVIGANGQPLGSIRMSTLYAASSPPERRASVVGSGTTDANGAFRFEVGAISRRLSGAGTIDLYISALKAGPPGGQGIHDSVLVTVRVVPVSEPPHITGVSDIRLPVR